MDSSILQGNLRLNLRLKSFTSTLILAANQRQILQKTLSSRPTF